MQARPDRWQATTLGRSADPDPDENQVFDRAAAPTEASGAVRALSLDPDRYVISEVLGEGGMGEVRRCRDRVVDRDVALKVVRPGAAIDDVEARFLREARVQARLDHPAVVPVYDVGHDVHGRAYFTMKRVEGVTLDQVVQRLREGDPSALHDYPRHRLLTAFARACIAVDYAHAHGVLHRDLKPANLMLGAFGEVYVLDWGLAKIVSAQEEQKDHDETGMTVLAPSDPGMTGHGIAMGTPAYMAPEQAAARPLDPRADVYALGAILFELLALEPLLGEEELRALRAGRAFSVHACPSVRAPRRATSPELDAVCIRATAYAPEDRFVSARALHEAVEAFLAADDEQGRIQRLAAGHVAKARALSAPGVEDLSRPHALEELGAALALSPDDPDARAHLVHLLQEPPRQIPHEVEHHSRVSWTAAAAAVAIALTALVWGPLFLVPGLAVAIVFGQLLVAPKAHRPHIVVLESLALAVPVYLAFRGVLDVYTPYGNDGIAIQGALGSSRSVFYVGLTAAHLATLLFGARFAGRYRDVLDARVIENALFSWQLTNLVPRRVAPSPMRSRPLASAGGESPSVAVLTPPPPPEHDGGITGDGRYTRIKPLAAPAGCEVWRCHDRRLDREVELQVALDAAADDAVCARAHVRGRLEHPAVAPLYDVGITPDGRRFFTAKLVRGTPLSRSLAEISSAPALRERARRRLLGALGQVCLAVAYAHEQGVTHGALDLEHIVLGGFGEVSVEGWSAVASESAALNAEADVVRLGEILRAVLDTFGATPPELDSARTPTASARSLNESIEALLSGERDDEVRRDLAHVHLERARAAANRAFGRREAFDVQAEARVEALREVGRAVRLHPEDPAATQLLFRLLTEPPPQPPPLVMEEVEHLRQEGARGTALAAFLFCGLWLVLYPVVVWLLGVKHLGPVIAVWASWALAEIAILHSIVRRSPVRTPWPMLAAMLAAMMTSVLSGPFFVTPVIATLATMSFVLVVARGWRRVTVTLGALVIVIPVAVAWLRALPTTDIVGEVIVEDGALHAPSYATTLLVLTVFHLLAVLFAAEFAARFRDRLDAVETAFLLRTWQLTKLLPQRGVRYSVAERRLNFRAYQ
ncbi:MAG: Protein kinase [Labilithrix sp.]|nr:Protein kinase [Labilithrix sp.]